MFSFFKKHRVATALEPVEPLEPVESVEPGAETPGTPNEVPLHAAAEPTAPARALAEPSLDDASFAADEPSAQTAETDTALLLLAQAQPPREASMSRFLGRFKRSKLARAFPRSKVDQPGGRETARSSGQPSSAEYLAESTSEPLVTDVDVNELVLEQKPSLLRRIFPKRGAAYDAPGSGFLPIRVILGYFPEVSEKDAREYAQGVAEKHFEEQGLVYFNAYKHDTGYVYEVHEGGDGRAFTPSILAYFKSQGSFRPGEQVSVVLKTATRYVEVHRLRDGLATILLPESAQREPTAWLKGTKQMTPAINRRTLFFNLACAVFATGVLALLATGLLFRLQPYDLSASPKPELISTAKLPRTQWARLAGTPAGFYVKALRYQEGKWLSPELESDAQAHPASPSPLTNAPQGRP